MKFSTASLLVAGLVLQASAIPIRILAGSVDGKVLVHVARPVAPTGYMIPTFYSPSAEEAPLPLHPMPPHHAKSRCAKSKAIQLSNWLRATFGMQLIEAGPHPPHPHPHPHPHPPKHRHHHHKEGEEGEFDVEAHHHRHMLQPQFIRIKGAPEDVELHRVHGHGHHGGRIHRWERSGFAHRLHHALLALGPWEGRIMAFVLGCGIGVLLRMVWVLTVVLFRAVASARRSREEQAETIFIYTEEGVEAENPIVSPPQYILVDEKVVLAEA